MANRVITVTLNQSLPGGQYSVSHGTIADPNGTAPATTTVAANVATLVADNPAVTPVESAVATLETDGASPTQAHVTALRGVWNTLSAAVTTHNGDANTVNTNWGTFLTAYTAYTGGVGKLTKNAAFFYDPAAVTTMNQARAILRKIEAQLAGVLTP